MKRILTILTIAMALAACSDKVGEWRPAPELQNVRDLMTEQPDSALKVLICFDVEDKANTDLEDKASLAATGCDGLQHEYQILVAEALYKNDFQQVGDKASLAATGVVSATAYYDSIFGIYPKNKDLAFETARAHYYKAVGETENDDIVAACEDYLKAADIMETSFPEIVKAAEKGIVTDENFAETRFMGLIYNRIGDILFAEYYYEQSINNYESALNYAECIGERMFVANLLKHIGDSYYLGNLPDSALVYYNKALVARSDNEILKYNINTTTASIYYEKGFADTAYNLLKMNMLSSDKFVIAQTFFTMGELLFKEVKYDSAQYYLEQCFENGSKPMRLASAKMLAEIHESTGDKERASLCNKFISENAINEINRGVKTKSLIDFYNNYKIDKHTLKVKNRIILSSIFAVVIAIVVFAIRSIVHRKQKKRIANDANWRLSVASGKLDNARRKISEQQEEIKAKDKEIDSIRRTQAIHSTEENLQNFRASDVCARIISRIDELNANGIKLTELTPLTSNELAELRHTADLHLNNITSRITGKYPKLNIDDVNLICLCMLNVQSSSMPALLGKSRSTIWSRTNKIASTFNIKPNETLEQVLISMI